MIAIVHIAIITLVILVPIALVVGIVCLVKRRHGRDGDGEASVKEAEATGERGQREDSSTPEESDDGFFDDEG